MIKCIKKLLKLQESIPKKALVNSNGRPKIEVDPSWLLLSKLAGNSNKELAKQIGCSERTIRRRLKEYNYDIEEEE